jgi:hypothetical protein
MSTLEVGKIVPATGTAITLGDSGDTFTVPSGAVLTVSGTFTSVGIDDNADATAITIDSSENVGINAGNLLMDGSGSVGISYAALSDDAVTSFTPGSNRGMIFAGGDSTHMGAAGYVCKNGGTTETYLLLDTASTFAVGTGVPTGTTGTDVKFNIFAANDGKIYFENRLGGGFTFWYFTMGLPW